MKKHLFLICAVFLLLGMGVSRAVAQSPAIQDLAFNSNGTYIDAASDGTFTSDASTLGVNLSSYSTYSTGDDLGTGLGKITFTTTASGFFDTGIWEAVGDATFYDEYAATGGSTASGESYEVANLNSATLPNVFTDVAGNSLDNANNVPGETSNFFDSCSGASCNASVGAELGYAFTVAAGDEEIITITASESKPSGVFYIEQSDPDGQLYAAGTALPPVYFSLSAEQIPVNSGPPPATPEPSTWLLLLTGLGAGATRLRRRFQFKVPGKLLSGVALLFAGLLVAPFASAQSVNTVPEDPTNPAAPHTAYAGATIVLGAIFNTAGSPDSFTYVWNYGDGTPVGSAKAVTNPNDISSSHIYVGTTVGQTWTAVVTVTDTTTTKSYTGNYLVIWEANTLASRVNVSIDWGLWFLHQSMYHPAAGQGNWTNCASGYNYACGLGYGSVTAINVQAYEVSGHLATGPATDPYTSDVQEGLAAIYSYLSTQAVASKSYTYNPATANFGCSDGTAPTTTNSGAPHYYCDSSATPVYYNSGATSCTAPPCSFTFDGNSNGKAVYATQEGYSWGYEDGQYADALVASGTPAATATSGAVSGESYKDIVQDIADAAAYCQYGADYDVTQGYTRGDSSGAGGGWWYDCQEGGDNSVSQWASIGLIGAQRGFGLTIPKIIMDANNVWVTNSQDVQSAAPEVNNPSNNSYADAYGAFGYNGSLYYSDPWGPYALTPSGMVQMSMDGVGRTTNTAFGDASTAADQRFNNAETYYADNFCNSTSLGPTEAPLAYTYGMFSFTKSMLLHNPGGVLTPIQYLRTQTPGVFTTDSSVPANTIDWYAALSHTNGGTDPCDGIAQTIVQRQYGPNNSPNLYGQNYSTSTPGFWFNDNYDGDQDYYETAWSLIMLQRTVFVSCVNNLQGVGAPGLGLVTKARVGLTWTGIPNVTGYNVQRGTKNGGPYTTVGSTTGTVYSDTSGLVNGDTYYYVLQPVNGAGAVCQSNQATATIP